MKIEIKEKRFLRVLLIAIAFYFAILRFDKLLVYAGFILNVLKPFIIGGIIAFIFNVPMSKLEKHMHKFKYEKLRRVIAFFVTLFLFGMGFYGFLMIVVPQLAETISTLMVRLQIFINSIPMMIESHSENLSFIEEFIVSQNINWADISNRLAQWMQNFALNMVNSGASVLSAVISGFTTALFSLIFAIYLLFGKEKNTAALKRLMQAVMGSEISHKINYIMSLSYRSFSQFLSGQCLEAVILGAMFVAAMTVFNMPYALLIGIVIAVTALIPVFGAFIGCAFAIVLIAIESPAQAAAFLALFLVLQQIEGNAIYPKVVGNSIGLPSILVFISVILGNSLMGVAGMLIFIPAASVVYTLTKEFVLKTEKDALPPQEETSEETKPA